MPYSNIDATLSPRRREGHQGRHRHHRPKDAVSHQSDGPGAQEHLQGGAGQRLVHSECVDRRRGSPGYPAEEFRRSGVQERCGSLHADDGDRHAYRFAGIGSG